MSDKIYNKLIRDNIPDFMKEEGLIFKVERVSNQEVVPYVINKFLEELEEVIDEMIECEEDSLLEELSDLISVIFKIGSLYGIEKDAILDSEALKTDFSGGFENNIILKYVKNEK